MRSILILALAAATGAAETRESLLAAVGAAPDKGSLTVTLARVHSAGIRAFFHWNREQSRLEALDCGGPASSIGEEIRRAIDEFRRSPAGSKTEGYRYTVPELISLAPGFQWERYFSAAGGLSPDSFTLVNPPVIRRLEQVLVLSTLDELKAYVRGCIEAAPPPREAASR